MRSTLEKRLAELTEQLCTGADVGDYSSYRHMTGFVRAYTEVLELMSSVRERLNKLERGQVI